MAAVREIEQFLYTWAPRELAAGWDNVGLLVGDPDREVTRILVALDVTRAVADEAARLGAELIVAHHPVMNVRWHEQQMQTLRDDTRLGGLLTALVRGNLSAICMHTNLDAAEGGPHGPTRGAGRGRRRQPAARSPEPRPRSLRPCPSAPRKRSGFGPFARAGGHARSSRRAD